LLHIIRKWYWEEIEAPRRINNSMKQWLSSEKKRKQTKKKIQDTEESDDSDFVNDDEVQVKDCDVPQVMSN